MHCKLLNQIGCSLDPLLHKIEIKVWAINRIALRCRKKLLLFLYNIVHFLHYALRLGIIGTSILGLR